MKNLGQVCFLLLVGLSIIGCASKQSVQIKPYTSEYAKEAIPKSIKSLLIRDLRKNNVVATISENGKTIHEYSLNTNLRSWLNDALLKDFSTANITTNKNTNTSLQINIIALNANFTMQLIFTSKGKIKTKYVKNSFKTWKISMRDAAAFENFLYENLSNSVINSVQAIVNTIE